MNDFVLARAFIRAIAQKTGISRSLLPLPPPSPPLPASPFASRIHDKDRLTRKNFPRISPDTARLKKLVDPEDLALVALRRGMMADRS